MVFDEAYCEFFVKDKLIFSDNIHFKKQFSQSLRQREDRL